MGLPALPAPSVGSDGIAWGNCRLSQNKTCIKNNVLPGYLAACLQNRANPLEHRRKLAYNDFVRCTISSSRDVGKGLS